jgi:hypothetical protein
MKTAREIQMKFGEGRPAMGGSVHDITIPAGTRVVPTDDAQFFVDDLRFLDRNSMAYHDAYHYGIRLNWEDVTD